MTTDPPLDLGDDHSLTWVSWAPDRELNPQYSDVPDIDKVGAHVAHLTSSGSECMGYINLDVPGAREITTGQYWTVESWEPLTLSPSLLCSCGDHGFIRDGGWVRA